MGFRDDTRAEWEARPRVCLGAVPREKGWRAEKGSGKDWLMEALNEAGVPE